MIGFLTSETSQKLSKRIPVHFESDGWKVSIGDGEPADFRLDKGILKFYCECVDRSILEFKSNGQVLEIMDSHARRIPKGFMLLFILNFEFRHFSFDQMLDLGIVAMTVDELHIVSELERFLVTAPTNAGKRQVALLGSNAWACINIINQYIKLGDQASALEWGRRAINENNPVSGAHHVVFNLLVKTGDLEGARKLAADAVKRKKDDLVLLRGLHKLAVQRGDTAEAEAWGQKIAEADREQPVNMNKLLGRQLPEPQAAPAKPPATMAEPRGLGLLGRVAQLVKKSTREPK